MGMGKSKVAQGLAAENQAVFPLLNFLKAVILAGKGKEKSKKKKDSDSSKSQGMLFKFIHGVALI